MSGAEPRPWREWRPDLAVGAAVAALGVVEVLRLPWLLEGELPGLLLVAVATGASAGLARRLPGAALTLVWVTCLAQGLLGIPVLLAQASVAVVAFGTARWGSRLTLLAGLGSMPLAGFVFLTLAQLGQFDTVAYRGQGGGAIAATLYDRLGASWPVALLAVFTTLLLAPWLVGLSLRLAERARASRVSQVAAERDAERAHRETQQVQEIARLQEEQARMARDVHDVVGHSLAVILAQAESAQFLTGEERLKETLATIATSARSSLQDVRHVLSGPQAPTTAAAGSIGDADALVAGVRGSGFAVEHHEVGPPRPLPPELATVAHRVLQEMLTNAMRHGRRDATIHVERHWPDGAGEQELRIEVRNVVAETADEQTVPVAAATGDPADGSGRGVDGMRRRLEAVGGRLDVRRRREADGPTYTATAWVPVRAGGTA